MKSYSYVLERQYYKETGREPERGDEKHFSSSAFTKSWGLQPGAWNCISVFHMCTGTEHLGQPPFLSQAHIELDQKFEPMGVNFVVARRARASHSAAH